MKLIVGLGNPGSKYQNTWHNLGFIALDKFFSGNEENFKPTKALKKFEAEVAEGRINDEKIILAKPLTFMNNSGRAVNQLVNFYKIEPQDLWLIHDEIDLPVGQIRISTDVSSGGHNGVKSIIENLGFKNFVRFRIGINRANRKTPTEKYVLQKINQAATMDKTTDQVAQAIDSALKVGLDKTMSQFN